MFFKVVIGAVGYAPKLAPAEREQVLEVARRFGVERQLGFVVVAYAQVFLFDAQFLQELEAVVFPVFKPFEVGVRLAEKFHFHLLELAQTENKVAGRYFVAEALAYLAYSERHARPSRTGHVFEVYENALRRFGAKIACGHRIFCYALECFEHEVEFFDGRKVGLAAYGAG